MAILEALKLFLFLVIIWDEGTTAAIISVPPVDIVGCYGGETIFHCESEIVDAYLYWTIDSDTLTDEIMESRGIAVDQTSYNTTSLTIAGLDINDGIYIGCSAIVGPPPYTYESQGAQFTVSDIPPVENLTIVFTNNGVMNITWSKPFCTPVNYSYNLSINTVPREVGNATQYSMDISSCIMNYTVTVSVINTDTDSSSHSTPESLFTDQPYSMLKDLYSIDLLTDTIVKFDDYGNSNVTVKYKIPVTILNCSHSHIEFQDEIRDTDSLKEADKIRNIPFDELLTSINKVTGEGFYTIRQNFSSSFKALYLMWPSVNPTGISNTSISTFNVQRISISRPPLSDAEVIIECVFAEDAYADGCFVMFNSTGSKDNSMNFTIDKDERQRMTDKIQEGEYDVFGYDIINGIANQVEPAYTTYFIISPSSTDSRSSITMSGNDIKQTLSVEYSHKTSITEMISSSMILVSSNDTVENVNNVTAGGNLVLIIVIGTISFTIIAGVLIFSMSLVILLRRRHICKTKKGTRVRGEQALVQKTTTTHHERYMEVQPVQLVLAVREHNDYNELVDDWNIRQPQISHNVSMNRTPPSTTFNSPPTNETDIDQSTLSPGGFGNVFTHVPHPSQQAVATYVNFPPKSNESPSILIPPRAKCDNETAENIETTSNDTGNIIEDIIDVNPSSPSQVSGEARHDEEDEDNYTASPLEESSPQGMNEMVATKQSTLISQNNKMEERTYSKMEKSIIVCVTPTFDVPIYGKDATVKEGIISDCTDFEDSSVQLGSTCVPIQATSEEATEINLETRAVQAKQTQWSLLNWKKIKDIRTKILKCWQYCG